MFPALGMNTEPCPANMEDPPPPDALAGLIANSISTLVNKSTPTMKSGSLMPPPESSIPLGEILSPFTDTAPAPMKSGALSRTLSKAIRCLVNSIAGSRRSRVNPAITALSFGASMSPIKTPFAGLK